MNKDIKKIVRSVRFALRGVSHAYRVDRSFRMEINYGLPIFLLLGYVLQPFTAIEFILFVFSYTLIIIVELINTAFEHMLDRVHPEKHEIIGRAKDIASAAVLLSFVFAAVVLVVLSIG